MFQIDNTGVAPSDDDHVCTARMVKHNGAIRCASKEVADPWIGILWMKADNQTFTKLVLATLCKRYGRRPVRRKSW